MFLEKPSALKISPAHKQVLRNLVIDEKSPGSILRDFETLLNMLRERTLLLTASEQFPLAFVSDLNKRMVNPIQLGLQRAQQKSYPHVHDLKMLARASGLTSVRGTAKKPSLLVDEEVYQQWVTLNPTERFFTLLETWMLRGTPEVLGERW